ncbi:TonB-dependent receptor [Pelomonas sp. Root1237]|uniref:TonB-dependent receptor n=1 Tax=Pelomonas sp. Root1237 TaxID=1736434 RepID=UPI0006FED5BD|nr:TonB-dependent receptor [Pelomonas sp. Root1237]KQV87047.1 TonB-dependent receptor [Pelomonas sp. Root1237]
MLKKIHGGSPVSRWTPLALAISAALAGQAHAQQPAAPADAASAPAAADKAKAQQLDTVTVTGIRRSIQSAIDRKRNASTVSDSIVAEDIDQFPDKNVGEALSRITGVQLSRQFGEGSQVSIRGVEPDLNRVEINGMSVLGTNGGAGRGAELRELASELISSIDVIKGSTADLTEGGIGGTVRITTRKPLDFTKRTIAGTLAAEQGSLRGGMQPRGTLLLADKFLDGKLGLMANLVYDKIYTRGDFSRNTSWAFLRDWDFSADKTITSLNANAAAVTTSAGCSSLAAADQAPCRSQWFDYSPRISRYGIWTRDHKRSSAEVTAQYQFTRELDAYVSYQANTQAQRLNDMNYGTDFSAVTRLASPGNAPVYRADATVQTAGTCVAAPTTTTPAGMVVENHHVTQFTVGNCLNVAGQGGQGAFSTSARDFALDIESKYTTAGFKFKNNSWRVEGLLGDSKSDYKSESNNIVLTQNAPGLVVKLDGSHLPQFTFPTAYSPDNASSYVQAQLQYRPSATKNAERQGKLDFQYNFDHNLFQSLWFGGQARESSSRQYNGGGYLVQNNGSLTATDEAVDINARTANVNQTFIWDPLYTGTAQRPNDAQTYINSGYKTAYVTGARMQEIVNAIRTKSPGTFMGGYGDVSGVPANWTAPNYAATVASGIFDTSDFSHKYLYSTPGNDGKTYPQIPAFDITEKVKAGYVRLDWGTEILGLPLDGNVGVRYTRTDVTSTGLQTDRTCNPATVSTCSPLVNTNKVVSISNSYSDVLPSLNATLQLINGKLLVRGGAAKVMARPAINLLAPNVTCTTGSGDPARGGDGTDDCTAGNPELKPYRATKYDLSVEYYPSRDTQVSLATFRTEIGTYVRTGVYRPSVNFYGDGRLFDVTQAVNGEGAKTQGIELAGRTALSFLPGWLGNFGVDANYTRMAFSYAKGNELISPLDNSVLPYPGMSKNSYNLGLWYDDGNFNARLAYAYRDKYYTGGNDVSGNPNFSDKTGYLDAKIQWKATKNFTLALEAKNLTNQAELTYAGDLGRPNELAWSGRRYYVTLGYKL